MPTIYQSTEGRRGCGFRQPGGLYMVAPPLETGCGRLPVPLEVCRTCGGGIVHTRGWRWIEPRKLFADGTQRNIMGDAVPGYCDVDRLACTMCPLGLATPERAGLLWVGRNFYPTPGAFITEAQMMGVSKRIGAVPRGFEAGKTWVYLAHVRAITRLEPHPEDEGASVTVYRPGIFSAFRPSLEYVIKKDDGDEKLTRLEDRGIKLVHVTRAGEPTPLPFDPAAPDPEEALL